MFCVYPVVNVRQPSVRQSFCDVIIVCVFTFTCLHSYIENACPRTGKFFSCFFLVSVMTGWSNCLLFHYLRGKLVCLGECGSFQFPSFCHNTELVLRCQKFCHEGRGLSFAPPGFPMQCPLAKCFLLVSRGLLYRPAYYDIANPKCFRKVLCCHFGG